MKHSLKITIILVLVFFLAQLVGLAVTDRYIDYERTTPEMRAEGNITWAALPYNIERPEIEETSSFLYIIIAILLGTIIVLFLIKFKKVNWWKIWFFLAVLITLTVAFAAFVPETVALVLAIILAAIKIFKPNIIIHNLTELFIYGGLAAIFVPIMNVFAIFILLILISLYDMYAVWKSQHMVKLAKFQASTKIFAGLFIPYNLPKKPKKGVKTKLIKVKVQNAILGGGDIGFPLIFAGVVMKQFGFYKTLIIPIVATIALLLLFLKSKKDKFYPAMPFLTAGCLIGYVIMMFMF